VATPKKSNRILPTVRSEPLSESPTILDLFRLVITTPLQRTNLRCGTGTKTQLPHSSS
jgi:hypothetical protein